MMFASWYLELNTYSEVYKSETMSENVSVPDVLEHRKETIQGS